MALFAATLSLPPLRTSSPGGVKYPALSNRIMPLLGQPPEQQEKIKRLALDTFKKGEGPYSHRTDKDLETRVNQVLTVLELEEKAKQQTMPSSSAVDTKPTISSADQNEKRTKSQLKREKEARQRVTKFNNRISGLIEEGRNALEAKINGILINKVSMEARPLRERAQATGELREYLFTPDKPMTGFDIVMEGNKTRDKNRERVRNLERPELRSVSLEETRFNSQADIEALRSSDIARALRRSGHRASESLVNIATSLSEAVQKPEIHQNIKSEAQSILQGFLEKLHVRPR